jgi:hypothetical protein
MGVAKFNYIMANNGIDGKGVLNTNTVGVRIPYEKFAVAISFGKGSYRNDADPTKYGQVSDTTLGAYYNFDKSTSIYLLASQSSHTAGTKDEGQTNTTAIGAQFKF